ncbi:DNA-binding protein HU-alpha, partial [Vibrio parahaemolyticus EKP-021]
MNKTQLIDF